MTPGLRHSGIPWLRDFSFFLFNTFVYEPILLKLSMNANIVKMQIFHKIKSHLRGHSRSQIMTFLIKNSPFLCLCNCLILKNKCRWSLWNNKVWLIQRRHLSCFNLIFWIRQYPYNSHIFCMMIYTSWQFLLIISCDNFSS